jgi:hypothetical protein
MKLRTVGAAILMLALAGCSKDKKSEPEKSAKADAAPVRPAPTPEPAEPEPVKTRAIELVDIGGRDKPLVIQAPEGTEVTMLDVDSDEVLPWAKLVSGRLDINVERPEAGVFPLEKEKQMISRGDKDAQFVHEVETDGGWELIVERGGKFDASVQHTRLEIACGSGELADRETADQVLEICRTIAEK